MNQLFPGHPRRGWWSPASHDRIGNVVIVFDSALMMQCPGSPPPRFARSPSPASLRYAGEESKWARRALAIANSLLACGVEQLDHEFLDKIVDRSRAGVAQFPPQFDATHMERQLFALAEVTILNH